MLINFCSVYFLPTLKSKKHCPAALPEAAHRARRGNRRFGFPILATFPNWVYTNYRNIHWGHCLKSVQRFKPKKNTFKRNIIFSPRKNTTSESNAAQNGQNSGSASPPQVLVKNGAERKDSAAEQGRVTQWWFFSAAFGGYVVSSSPTLPPPQLPLDFLKFYIVKMQRKNSANCQKFRRLRRRKKPSRNGNLKNSSRKIAKEDNGICKPVMLKTIIKPKNR